MLTIRLLGQPTVLCGGRTVEVRARKARALLWYLAGEQRTFSRAHLAALLWEDADEEHGRNSLTTTLHVLRRSLPVWPLQTDREHVGWDQRAPVSVDTERLDGWRPTAPDARKRAQAAIDLWRGPPLEDFHVPASGYQAWLLQKRNDLTEQYLSMLTHLAALLHREQAWHELNALSRRGLSVDPLREQFHRWRMQALVACGQRVQALSHYEKLCELLRRELGVPPDPSTVALRTATLLDQPAQQRAVAPAVEVAEPTPTPLVGRGAAIASLQSILSQPAHGRIGAAVLLGEAGIGKTRLVEEVCRLAAESHTFPSFCTVMTGRASALSRHLPYGPFLGALRGSWTRSVEAATAISAIWRAELGRLLPELADAIGGVKSAVGLDGGQEQQRQITAFERLLEAMPPPLLLVLEDIQHLDESSLALLARILAEPRRRLGLLLTGRPELLFSPLRSLLYAEQSAGRLVRIDIGPLSPRDHEELVRNALGYPQDDLAARLMTRSGGNPFFAVELLKPLGQGGSVQEFCTSSRPARVRAAIAARLHQLSTAALDLLELMATSGDACDLHVLVRAADDTESPAGLAPLETLLAMGLVREIEPNALVGPRVAFAHQVVREELLHSLSAAKRHRLQRRMHAARLEAPAHQHGP